MSTIREWQTTCPVCKQQVNVYSGGEVENHTVSTGPEDWQYELCSQSGVVDLNLPGGSVKAIPTAFEQGKNRGH